MAFHRRKLLDLSLYCKPYCDVPTKFNGYCPSECFDVCPPDTCTEQINQTPPPPPPPPPPSTTDNILNKSTPLSLLLIASLAVLATAFFIFTCYTIYKFYVVWLESRRRRPPQPRRSGDDDDGDSIDGEDDYGPAVDHPIWYIRTAGLQPSVINAIAIVKYKKSDGLVDGTDCAVCLSEFQEDETVRLLPKCSHAFHIPCIDTWLASHTNCPMCRAGIVSSAAAAAAAPSPPAHDSGGAEEAQPEASAEARVEIEDENIGGKMDAVQPVRRSVSMDSISASMITAAVANALCENNKQLDKGKESDVGRRSVGVNRSSIERGRQIAGSSSIKRSASCSAKVFLSRHCSRNGR